MAINSIRSCPQWHMPKLLWQAITVSVFAHGLFLVYLSDISLYNSPPVMPGQMNIVLQTTLAKPKPEVQQKPEARKEIIKPVPKPAITPESRPKPKPIVRKPLAKKTEPVTEILPEITPVIETHEKTALDEVETIEQQSYIPPRSDVAYLSNPKPVYPRAAKRRGMQGTVVLEIEVSVDGKPLSILIAESSGFKILDVAAKKAVSDWQFIPAQRNGVAVVASVDVPIRFILNEAE